MSDDFHPHLNARRNEFNAFIVTVITPLLGNSHKQLGFVEVAEKITDASIRKKYCELAIAMLEESIVDCDHDIQLQPVPEYSRALIIVCAAVVIALGYAFVGLLPALLGAAVLCGIAELVNQYFFREKLEQVQRHNVTAAAWDVKICDFGAARDALLHFCQQENMDVSI